MPRDMFYAHSLPGRPESEWQRLEDHLTEVSRKTCCCNSNPIYAEIVGLLHDIGKYSLAFQDYLRASSGEMDEEETDIPGKPDHSSAGSQLVMGILREKASHTGDAELARLAELIGRILAHPIAGHHTGLLDSVDIGTGVSLDRRIEKQVEPYASNIRNVIVQRIYQLAALILEDRNLEDVCCWIDSNGSVSGREAFSLQFAIRMLFSALVDADRLDSERVGNPDQWITRTSVRIDSLSVLLDKLERHLATLPADGIVNKVRKEVSEQCAQAAEDTSGFFDLTVPTGGGKTFASLRFALAHAVKREKRRVIYVMPYTSIIEQNADEFRKVLDQDSRTTNVLEHHSNLEPKKETAESKLLAENWESPVIMTTSVQFLETLYAAKPSRCRRLHAIRESVVILDEAQTVPVRYLKAVTWALEELTTNYGCSVVFCTATQPLFNSSRLDGEALDNHRIGIRDIRPIVKEPRKYFVALKRVQVRPVESDKPLSGADIAAFAESKAREKKSVLCVLNTKSMAKAVFKQLSKDESLRSSLWHLSTSMCPQHRKDVIDIVKLLAGYHRNTRSKTPVVISTQLIEAGVNLDFDVVLRAMAGIDSIAQAAGRCNREGRLPCPGEVWYFKAEENLRSLRDIAESQRAGIDTLSALDDDALLSESEKNPIGLKAVEEYFQRLYWSRSSEMDSKGIVARLISPRRLEEGADVPFASIATDFCLIEQDTVSIIVPYGDEGKSLVSRLLRGAKLGFSEYRIAGRYAVQIFRDSLPRFQPLLPETESGWLVLGDDRYYGETGLLGPDELSVEDYIV